MQSKLPLEIPAGIEWIAPSKGRLIHVRRNPLLASTQLGDTPLCRNVPYVSGFVAGAGVEAVAYLERTWCQAFLVKLQAHREAEAALPLAEDAEAHVAEGSA